NGNLPEASDVDGDELTYALADAAQNGAVTVNADGSYVYTPNTDYNGSDQFTYTVTDGEATVTYTVNITVTPVNDAPVANDDTAETDEDTPVTINVLDNDSDPDGDPLTVTEATAENGNVTIGDDGELTYTPNT